MNNYPPTPELDKMLAVKDKSQIIGELLDWLENDKGMRIGFLEDNEFYPSYESIEKLLASYFEIDLNKAEKERRAILNLLQ